MPQIILECSDNVTETNLTSLFYDIHNILTEKLPTQLESCKTRMIRHRDYYIADGNINNGFVHLSIGVLKGRSKELLDSIAPLIMEKLRVAFLQSLQKLDLQITIAIYDLPEVYHKYVNA
jgi:5-carboxymethyl-2-hydroxymuconate isomerase